jgi:hypothetical protein
MPSHKLKRRRGVSGSSKGGSGARVRMALCLGVLVVLGVFVMLMNGLSDAIARQKGETISSVHGEMSENAALTRPPSVPAHNMQAELMEKHRISLLQEAENRKRLLTEKHKARIEEQAAAAAHLPVIGILRHGAQNPGQQHKKREPPHVEIQQVKMPPPEWLGGPYPYPLEPPPAGYDIHESYEPLGGFRFGEYTDGSSPYVITDEIKKKSDDLARARRVYIKQMMQTAWKGYAEHAFGLDEVKPVTGTGDNGWGGFAVTLVDSLDTLWLCDMKDEFYQARDWVRDSLNNNKARHVSVFETNIRSLGGLLSAYDWSGDQAFLDKALDLGQRLIKAFDGSNTGLPYGQVNLATGQTSNINWARGSVILSEFGSLQLEFRWLDKFVNSPLTSEMRHKVEHVFEVLHKISPPNGLYPYYMSNNDPSGVPQFRNNHLTFGAMADSFYEYMLKVWIQGGRVEPMYREMYDKAIQGMHDELLQVSTPSGLIYIADKIGPNKLDRKMDHLVCFMGGLLALGAYTDPQGFDSARAQRDLKTGKVCTFN